jgi:hypothetical protein
VFLLVSISNALADNNSVNPIFKLSDEAVVDRYLHSTHTMETKDLEHEIVVRGSRPGIVAKIRQSVKSGTPKDKSLAEYLANMIPYGFMPYAIGVLQTQENDFDAVMFATSLIKDVGDPKAIPALRALYQDVLQGKCKDPEGHLKRAVEGALVACKDSKSFPELDKVAEGLTDKQQISFYASLAEAGDPVAKNALRQMFSGKLTPYNVVWGMEILYACGDASDFPLIKTLIAQDQQNPHNPYAGDVNVEENTFISTTFPLPPAEKAKKVASFLNAKHEYVKEMAIEELGRMGTPQAIDLLKASLNDQWLNIQMAVMKALRKNGKTISYKVDGWKEILSSN